jgi:hypothetical protein
MPRYFFHIHNGTDTWDVEGVELSGLAEARNEAITSAGEMIRHRGSVVWSGVEWRMQVTDETGRTVFTLHFSASSNG